MPDVAPSGWKSWEGDDEYGIEEIVALDWAGGDKAYLLLEERHVEGKAAIVDGASGWGGLSRVGEITDVGFRQV